MSEQPIAPVLDASVLEGLRELGGSEDPGLFAEIVDLFLADAQGHLENLTRALAAGDLELLRYAAHTLKSSSANVGAVRFSDLCLQIEQCCRNARLDGVDQVVEAATKHYDEVRRALEAAKG